MVEAITPEMGERCIIPFVKSTTTDNDNVKKGHTNTRSGRTSPTTLSITAQPTLHNSKTIEYENRKEPLTKQ